MTDLEIKLITTIRENPKAMDIAIDVLTRLNAGESVESIMESYGIEWEGIGV